MADEILGISGHLDISDIEGSLDKLYSAISQISGISQEMAKKMESAYKAVGEATEEELAKKSKEALDVFTQVLEEVKKTADKNVSSIENTIESLEKQLSKATDEIRDIPMESDNYKELQNSIDVLNQQIGVQTENLTKAKEEAEELSAALEKVSNIKIPNNGLDDGKKNPIPDDGDGTLPPGGGTNPPGDELQQSREAAELLIEKLKELAEQSASTHEELQKLGEGENTDVTNIDDLKAKLEEYKNQTQETADAAKAAYQQQQEYVASLNDALDKVNEAIKNADPDSEAYEELNKLYAQLDEEATKASENLDVLGKAVEKSAEESEQAKEALERCNEQIRQMGEDADSSGQQVDSFWQKLKGWATGNGKLSEGLDTFRKGLDKLPIPLRTATEGVGDMVKGMWAMCKTPLGAVLAAITLALQALFQWFTKNAEGQKEFARISAYISSILSSLSDIAVKVGRYLFHAFADAGAPMNAFAKGLVTTFKSAVEAVIDLVGGLGNVVKGIFTLDWDTFTKGLSQTWNGLKGAGQTVINAIDTQIKGIYGVVRMASDGIKELSSTDLKGQLNQMHQVAKENADLAFKQKETEIAISHAKEKEAELDAEIAKSREKIYTLTGKERLEEIQKLKAMQQQKYDERIKQYQELYDIQKRTNQLHSSTLADEEKERQLNIQLLQLKAQQAAATRMTARLEESTKRTMLNDGKKGARQGTAVNQASAKLGEIIYQTESARIKLEKDLEERVTDARIEAMEEGFEKTLALRERQKQKELDAIEKEREEALEAERKRQKAEYEAEQAVIKAQGGKTVGWNNDMFKQDESVKKINSAFDSLKEETTRKFLQEQQMMELQSMRDYLKEYGTFQQKKLAIAEEYAKKIRQAEASGNKWEVKRLEAERDREVGGAKASELAQGIDFTQLVSGVGDVVRKIGEETYKKIQEYKTTDEYKQSSAESKKSIAELESQVVDVGGAGSVNLFSPGTWEAITIATENYNDALEEQRQRYEEERLAIEKQKKATKEYEEALRALNNETDIRKRNELSVRVGELKGKKETADKNAETASSNKKDADNKVTTAGTQVTTSLTKVNRELGNFNTALSQITSGSLKGFADGLTNLISGGKKTSLAELGKGGGIVGLILTIIDMLGDNPSEAIAGIIDGILKCVDAIIAQLLNGDLISTLVTHIATGIAKIFQSLFEGLMNISTFGLFSFGGKDNHQEMLDIQAKLTKSIESTTAALNKMTQELERSYGAVAMAYGDKAEELIRKNLESIVKGIDSVLTDNYGGGHSDYYHLNKNQDLLRQIEEYGKEYGIKAGNGNGYAWQELLANNSPENLAKLFKTIRDSGDDLWRIITQESGYNEGALQEWIEKLIDTYDQFDENAEQLAEQLTTTTKENVFDDFLENLYNMADGSETVFEDIADDWQKMVNRMTINNLVSENYKKKLEDWYKSLTELNKEKSKANTTMTDEEYKIQLDKLKQEYEDFTLDAKRDIEQLKEVGVIAPTGDNANPDQEATYNSLEKWTYEQADDLIARATAMQIILEHIYEKMQGRTESQTEVIQNLSAIGIGISDIGQGVATSIEIQTSMNGHLAAIRENTAPISEIRDLVRKIYNER